MCAFVMRVCVSVSASLCVSQVRGESFVFCAFGEKWGELVFIVCCTAFVCLFARQYDIYGYRRDPSVIAAYCYLPQFPRSCLRLSGKAKHACACVLRFQLRCGVSV